RADDDVAGAELEAVPAVAVVDEGLVVAHGRSGAVDGQLRPATAFSVGNAVRSWSRELIPSFVNTLPRCHSTGFALMRRSAPISGFESPSRASLAICSS